MDPEYNIIPTILYSGYEKNKIVNALAQLYMIIDFGNPPIKPLIRPNAVIVDLLNPLKMSKEYFDKIYDYTFKNKIPLVLLNVVDTELLSNKIAVTCKGNVVIISPYRYFDVINVLDLQYERVVNPSIVKQGRQRKCITSCSYNSDIVNYNNSPEEIANKINYIINSIFIIPQGYMQIPSLPPEKFRVAYININHNGQIAKGSNQRCNNNITFEVSLFSSNNPANKYLLVRTLGEGLNPGHTTSNNRIEKGWIQSKFDMVMKPMNSSLSLVSMSPYNLIYESIYEATSKFEIGVDLSKFPAYSEKVEISNALSSEITGFNLESNMENNSVNYKWKMEKLDKGLFKGNCSGQTFITELPNLALTNLKPVTSSLWRVNNSFNEKIDFYIKCEESFSYALAGANSSSNQCVGIIKESTHGYGFFNDLVCINFDSVLS